MNTINNTNTNAVEPKTLLGKQESMFNAATVAAISAAGAGALTMIGSNNLNVGGVVGVAAATGVSYIGTKWLTEAIGCEDNGLGKFIGLMVGIDLGYGITKLGMDGLAVKVDEAKNML